MATKLSLNAYRLLAIRARDNHSGPANMRLSRQGTMLIAVLKDT